MIVFSHGSTNDSIDYAYTLELIAGEGFAVAAPSHVNNTQDDVRSTSSTPSFRRPSGSRATTGGRRLF